MTTPHEAELRELFREYTQAKRELLAVTNRCYLKGWPDRKAAVEALAKMSELLIEQELLRFDYLMSRVFVDVAECKSLESILLRISKAWRDSDEAELEAKSPSYREVSNRLAAAAPINKAALDGPGKGAQRDREWQEAFRAFNKKHDELDSRLSRLHLR